MFLNFPISSTGTTDVFGVADGVGGWRNHGVDPSRFSRALVQKLEDLVKKGEFDVRQPVQLLARAYNRMYAIEDMMGSSTACIVSFDRKTKVLYTANLGDSGFLVIRDGKVVHQSRPQTHGFNAPWQLSIVPETMRKGSYDRVLEKNSISLSNFLNF